MRAALTSAGARLLEAVLAGEDGYCGPRAGCGCGAQAACAGHRSRTVTTVLGPVTLRRAWYHCAECRHGFAPRDQQLGVPGCSLSPGLAEMTALAGAEVSFGRAAGLLSALAGITISARTIERSAEASGAAARSAAAAEAAAIRSRAIVPLPPAEPVPDMLYVEVDGTGVPVRASETEGRQGKADDGKASTREVKLARLFTVSRLDDDGRPVMDPGSSTYAFTFDGKDVFAGLVGAEYQRRGGGHFRQVVALGDGAAWICYPDILSGVLKITYAVFAVQACCGRVCDGRLLCPPAAERRCGIWRQPLRRPAGCQRADVVPAVLAWPGRPRRRRSSRFSPCAAASAWRSCSTSARWWALAAVSSAVRVRTTLLSAPGSAAGRAGAAVVCCWARRCSIRERRWGWL